MKKQRFKSYEVLWFERGSEDTFTKEFSQKRSALKFYEEHKNDPDKYEWWVTKRNHEWEVVETYIIDQ